MFLLLKEKYEVLPEFSGSTFLFGVEEIRGLFSGAINELAIL